MRRSEYPNDSKNVMDEKSFKLNIFSARSLLLHRIETLSDDNNFVCIYNKRKYEERPSGRVKGEI